MRGNPTDCEPQYFQGYSIDELMEAIYFMKLADRMKRAGVYDIAMKAVELHEAEESLMKAEKDLERWKKSVEELKAQQNAT